LLQHGRTVFFGASSLVEAFFDVQGFATPKSVNPADHYLDVIAGGWGPRL
jgi:hypothetical protein